MSMHIEGPWLSTTGKYRSKKKFRSAEAAQKSRELDAEWADLKRRWAVEEESKRQARALKAEPLTYSLSAPPGRETQKIASRDTGHIGPVRSKDIPQYTGDHVVGVTVLHKSCLQPVFSKQDAIDAAKMRR